MKRLIFLMLATILSTGLLGAHPGRTDANGGHNDRKNGGYHYHSAPAPTIQPSTPTPQQSRPVTPTTYPFALSGKVISIADGDTFTVLVGTTQFKVRLNGIDAPEIGQAFGSSAKEYLAGLIFNQIVNLWVLEKDLYDRYIADATISGLLVNAKLIEVGLAWHYKAYSTDIILAQLEIRARQRKAGLWADQFPTAPWDFRK